MAQEIGGQLWIGQLQKRGKCKPLGRARLRNASTRKAREQDVELFHTPPAAPQKPAPVELLAYWARGTVATHEWRSTSIFLISAMAFAGLRSLGHTSVQFMIVWQR